MNENITYSINSLIKVKLIEPRVAPGIKHKTRIRIFGFTLRREGYYGTLDGYRYSYSALNSQGYSIVDNALYTPWSVNVYFIEKHITSETFKLKENAEKYYAKIVEQIGKNGVLDIEKGTD